MLPNVNFHLCVANVQHTDFWLKTCIFEHIAERCYPNVCIRAWPGKGKSAGCAPRIHNPGHQAFIGHSFKSRTCSQSLVTDQCSTQGSSQWCVKKWDIMFWVKKIYFNQSIKNIKRRKEGTYVKHDNQFLSSLNVWEESLVWKFCQCGIVNIMDPIPRQMRDITTGIPHKIEKEWGWAAAASKTQIWFLDIIIMPQEQLKPSWGLLSRVPGPQTEATQALGFQRTKV